MGEVSRHPAAVPTRPERLTADHDLSAFQSDEPELDEWLRKRALKNEGRTSRTYVVCAGGHVIAYYALANGAVQRAIAPSKVKRNAPDPIPVMVLGRLAVDRRWTGKRIGPGLLRDAILRVMQASEVAGIAALLVHAISERARTFYEAHGFERSDLEPMTLMITLKDAQAAL